MWTVADIFQAIGLLVTLAIAIGGWFKGSAERDKLEAETAVLYANLSADGAKREKGLRDEIEGLSRKLGEQDKKIAELNEVIEQKDNRIKQLETLTVAQEKEIQALRSELDSLKTKHV